MAHSIKGMAASLEYESITEVAHGLEDRMQGIRSAGRVAGAPRAGECCSAAWRRWRPWSAVVRESGESPPRRPELAQRPDGRSRPESARKKKSPEERRS